MPLAEEDVEEADPVATAAWATPVAEAAALATESWALYMGPATAAVARERMGRTNDVDSIFEAVVFLFFDNSKERVWDWMSPKECVVY